MRIFYTKSQYKISQKACSSSSLSEFDNPTFEDALRRIECDTASDELLIKQANMKDFLYAYSDVIDESFEKGQNTGVITNAQQRRLTCLRITSQLKKS